RPGDMAALAGEEGDAGRIAKDIGEAGSALLVEDFLRDDRDGLWRIDKRRGELGRTDRTIAVRLHRHLGKFESRLVGGIRLGGLGLKSAGQRDGESREGSDERLLEI